MMVSRTTKLGLAAAAAGVAMLFMTAAPASAFSLSAPSLVPDVAGANVEHVYWHHWHYWHGGGWGWHHRRCWMSPWGWRCRW